MSTQQTKPDYLLLICDIQEAFRSAIHGFPNVVSTAQKMIEACKILNIPIAVSTQNKARLGDVVPEIKTLLPPEAAEFDKTRFSMIPPTACPPNHQPQELQGSHILLLGIEAHICVLQTALHFRAGPAPPRVSVLADGVSSCNAGERGVAFDRMRAEGCVVVTSESVLFEILGDAKHDRFKEVSALVKKEKGATKEAVEMLCASLYAGGVGSKL